MYPSPPRCRNHPSHKEANTGCGTPSGNGLRCSGRQQGPDRGLDRGPPPQTSDSGQSSLTPALASPPEEGECW